jgi:transcriptional regulator with XRE-family HTH domain
MAIAKIERGERSDPKLSTLEALAKALGCELSDLTTEVPPAA